MPGTPDRQFGREAAGGGSRNGYRVARRGDGAELAGLNPEQLAAVTYLDGPLLVLAGAGTGKTKVLTARAVHIVRSTGTPARQVLNLTFTSDAGAEMRERTRRLGGDDAAGLRFATYNAHGSWMCYQMPELAGLKPGFELIRGAEQLRAVRAALDDAGEKRAAGDRSRVWQVAQALARLKETGVRPDAAIGDCNDPDMALAGKIYAPYQDGLRRRNQMDFADQVLWPTLALETDPAVQERFGAMWRYFQADEHQDVSRLNARMLKALVLASVRAGGGPARVMVVGDDSQSIYEFRGASVESILRFPDEWTPQQPGRGPACRVILLERNYRSTAPILAVANAVIGHNTRGFKKTLVAASERHTPPPPVEVWLAPDLESEAAAVMEAAGEALASGAAASVFVLYRPRWLSRPFEEAAVTLGLSYQLVGDQPFWGRAEVLDALCWLAFMEDPSNVAAFERIANTPPRGLGDRARAAIIGEAQGGGGDLIAAARRLGDKVRSDAREGITALAALRRGWTAGPGAGDEQQLDGLGERLRAVLKAAGVLDRLALAGQDDQLDNLDELFRVADRLEEPAALLRRAGRSLDAVDDDAPLKLMTLHAAKGLEADVVFLPGWVEGIFPARQAIEAEEGEEGEEEGRPPGPLSAGAAAIESERRLAYVGLTRGRERVVVSGHAEGRKRDAPPAVPARFIAEMGDTVVRRALPRRRLSRGQTPRPKQLAFAQQLARQTGVALPPEVAADRIALSAWIDERLAAGRRRGGRP